MRRIKPIDVSARSVFDACAGRTSDNLLKTQLLLSGPGIELAAEEYEELGARAALHDYSGRALFPFPASEDDLRNLYGRVLRDGGERPTYDLIMGMAPGGVCPQCGIGRVRTLDHYLPKTHFPELSVSPTNLVPTCRDCNFDKLAHHSNQAEDFLFHPYFDDWDQYRLVRAHLVYSPKFFVRYSIAASASVPPIVAQRAAKHFSLLNLGALYSMNAGAHLRELKINCARASQTGAQSVRELLDVHEGAAASVQPNGWRAAMYKAMKDDDQFWGGAFQGI